MAGEPSVLQVQGLDWAQEIWGSPQQLVIVKGPPWDRGSRPQGWGNGETSKHRSLVSLPAWLLSSIQQC